jgi:hypothetical protein
VMMTEIMFQKTWPHALPAFAWSWIHGQARRSGSKENHKPALTTSFTTASRDPKQGGKDFGYGSPDSGFRSMATNLKCSDTHYFPKQPSPGFASKAPQIMPVEGMSYPNLKLGIYAKPNVLYGSWQIPEILPRDPSRPDVQHFLHLEARSASHAALSGVCSPSLVLNRRAKAPRLTPTKTSRSTPRRHSRTPGTQKTCSCATARPSNVMAPW